jgi:hypothetical protein
VVKAELRKTSNQSIIKKDDALAIVKEYMGFSPQRKSQYFVVYDGKDFSNDQVRYLMDQLRSDE